MEYSSPFYILIMLSFSVTVDSTCTDGNCRELAFPSVFFFANKRLMNHNIRTVQVRSLKTCELLCYREPDCVSVNFDSQANAKGVYRCDLNNATHRGNDGEFLDTEGFFYRGSKSACDTARCDNGGTCQSGFTDKGYRCLCPPGFMCAHCKQDIDECATAVHNCSGNAVCNNSYGSYSCKCKPEFIGDGFSCSTEGWTRYNVSRYYMTSSRSSNVSDARQKCKDMGADLPVIYSKEENDFIKKNFNDKLPEGQRWIWLGLLRKTGNANSRFFWVDSTPIKGKYEAWGTGEPNNVNNNENCAYIGKNGNWNDFKCEISNGPYVLCQMAM